MEEFNNILENNEDLIPFDDYIGNYSPHFGDLTKIQNYGMTKRDGYPTIVLLDAGLTEEEWNDPTFRAACRKYRELQDSSRALKLIKSAQGVVDKITDYFDTLDIQERDAVTGKPIFKTKDIMGELKEVSNVVEQLKTLEFLYKKEQEESNGLMGDVETGFMD